MSNLSFAICHLPIVICNFSFVNCRLLIVICRLRIVVCRLLIVFYNVFLPIDTLTVESNWFCKVSGSLDARIVGTQVVL